MLHCYSSCEHELDFVAHPELMIEVERGAASAFEFAWLPRAFPKARLLVAGRERFRADRMHGLSIELLLDESW